MRPSRKTDVEHEKWQLRANVLANRPPERRSRGGNQQAQLVGGPVERNVRHGVHWKDFPFVSCERTANLPAAVVEAQAISLAQSDLSHPVPVRQQAQ